LKVKSDEKPQGSWASVTANLLLTAPQPSLFFSPSHIETGASFGDTVYETITLENRGLANMEDVALSLVSQDGSPAPSWVHLNASAPQGTLEVGEKRAIDLSFTPTEASATEGDFTFYLRVTSSNYKTSDILIFATVTQSGIGNVLFKVSDIYTGTLSSSGTIVQGLSGASITIQNEAVLTIEKSGVADGMGELYLENLPSGRYKYRVSANSHQEHIGRIWIKAGITAVEPVFLEYNLVTVEWEVVETSIQDVYEIVLKATFETNVPAPVVVCEPSSVNIPAMKEGEVFQGEFAITNYGLIRADGLVFDFPTSDQYFRYELMSGLPGSLGAKEKLTIPYRITCLKSPARLIGGRWIQLHKIRPVGQNHLQIYLRQRMDH